MNEKTAWNRFRENGSVSDYLMYKDCVNEKMQSEGKTEMTTFGENNGTGACNTGADRRGVR